MSTGSDCVASPLTKEAVDDSKEAAHGADHRGHDLVPPLNLLVALQPHLHQTQQLAGRSHDGLSQGGRQRSEVAEEGRGEG